MTIDQHLRHVLAAHYVNTGIFSPLRGVQNTLEPVLRRWGGQHLIDLKPSGSFAKGTAVHGGTDIDLFASLTSTLTRPLRDIYESLLGALNASGYAARRQNVSIGIAVGGWKVDVTPGRRQDQYGNLHSLYSNKTGTWLQTNINAHCRLVSGSGRLDEIRLMKIWRNRFGLDWSSFYLELFVIDALRGTPRGNLQANVVTAMRAVADTVGSKRFVDPANTNNVVSDTLSVTAKVDLSKAARSALNSRWDVVFV